MAIKKGHKRLTIILENKITRALHTKKGIEGIDINKYITDLLLKDKSFEKYLKILEDNENEKK